MATLIDYDPFAEPGIDELFRGFFQPVRREGCAAFARSAVHMFLPNGRPTRTWSCGSPPWTKIRAASR